MLIISLMVVFVGTFVIFLLYIKKVNPSQPKNQIVTAFIGSLLVTFLNLLFNALTPIKLPEDYVKLNSPSIEPELVINRIDKEGYYFNFIIRNTGNLPADNIKYIFKAPGVAGIENIPPINRTLSGHSSTEYNNPAMIKTNFSDQSSNDFRLFVSYDATINGETKNYYAFFRWILDNNELREKNYICQDANRQEGTLKYEDISQIFHMQNFISNILENFPGYSFDMIIELKDTLLQREKYILDLGYNENKDRISVFMTKDNDLCFRIIDSLENSYEAIIKRNQNIIDFKNPFYLNCEFGIKNNISFLRICIAGECIEQKIINKSIKISLTDKLLKTLIVGGDINFNHCGIFRLEQLATFASTHASYNRIKIAKMLEDRFKYNWINFNGNLSLDHSKLGMYFKTIYEKK